MFKVSKWTHLSAQYDRIFDCGTTAFLVEKLELKDFFIYEPVEELLSWNKESKLITPKFITGTYFGSIVTILIFLWFTSRSLKLAPANFKE